MGLKIDQDCITASCLFGLARMLDRLAALHHKMGGPAPDAPCLTELGLEGTRPYARVKSGVMVFRLVYVHGEWAFD